MKLRNILAERHWVEQENGSWWNQTTSEYMTQKTFILLQEAINKEVK